MDTLPSPIPGSWGNIALLGRTWASGKRGLWSDAVGCMGIWRRWVQLRQVFFASRQMFCAQPPTAWKLLRSGGNLTSQPPVGCIHFQISEIYTHQSDDAMCACALHTDLYCFLRVRAADLVLGNVLRINMSVHIGLSKGSF